MTIDDLVELIEDENICVNNSDFKEEGGLFLTKEYKLFLFFSQSWVCTEEDEIVYWFNDLYYVKHEEDNKVLVLKRIRVQYKDSQIINCIVSDDDIFDFEEKVSVKNE